MVQEEIIKLKAEIYDIICQQEEYITMTNTVQQTKSQKVQLLKNIEKTSPAEDIIKLKAEIFDIIQKQEEYIIITNNLQQQKLEKIQRLRILEKEKILDIERSSQK